MAFGEKRLPVKINLDIAAEYMPENAARFIKNLTDHVAATDRYAGIKEGQNINKLKSLQANELYVDIDIDPSDPDVQPIGTYVSKETNQVLVLVYSPKGNHFIYVINCDTRTADIVYARDILNFQLDPKYFVHESGAYLEVLYITNPDTQEKLRRTFFMFTDGFQNLRQICIEDSIATSGFDATLFPYFAGNYNRELLIDMGVPTPKDCIEIAEIPQTETSLVENNTLLFNTWKFRIRDIDVYGRPSEYGIISDIYIPGINDCIANSTNLPRCLNLTFDAGNPFVNQKEIAWLRSNETVWHIETVLDLYVGSNFGSWWLRPRNPDITYDASTNKITYQFCRDKECNAIGTDFTSRLDNRLPRTSQAIEKIGDFIGLANNKDGFFPFSKSLRDKIKFIVEPPSESNFETRKITIYAAIYNNALNNYQQVFKDGSTGYSWGDNNSKHGGARNYLQYMTNIEQSGFGGYFVNGNSSISTQVYVDAAGNLIDDPDHNGMNLSPSNFTLQKWEFTNLPPGTYIFRLFSTLADPSSTTDVRSTSTTVWGVCPYNKVGANFNINTNGRTQYNTQELVIDVCDNDYDTLTDNKILVIADLAYHVQIFLGDNDGKSQSGYIYETQNDGVNEFPMELMSVTHENGNVIFSSLFTDHNGFYWTSARQNSKSFYLNFLYKCLLKTIVTTSNTTGMVQRNFIIDQYLDGLYSDYDELPCNRVLIKGKVLLNGTAIGVPNILVALTRGGSAMTDNDGNYSIVAHDDVTTNPRRDKLIITNGVCNYQSTTGECILPIPVTIVRCGSCGSERIINIAQTLLIFKTERSLLSGETYGVGVVGFDLLGRATFVQDEGYIKIPSITETQTIGASKVKVQIAGDAVFPVETEYITFWITEGITIADYLDWIVDSVVFVDNTGAENTVSPTQIKIYYRSLIEYNAQNNYNTTTAWQFIPENENTPVKSDKIQFLINGDGKFFPKSIVSLIKYDSSGQFILIDYNTDLKDLKENALIRLIRPRECISDNQQYFEICSTVNIINRHAEVNEFYLNAFDTYYLSRQIPVPTSVNPSGTETTSTTTTTTNNPDGSVTQVVATTNDTTSTINENRIFGFPFEHHSPSDFWGLRVWNSGRVNVKNPYETELIHLTQIALSGALSSTGQLNFLNYFEDIKKTDINVNNSGGIYYLSAEIGVLFAICQYDNFSLGYNDNVLRVINGNVQVSSAENLFGRPERKIGNNYGCQAIDKNSIRKRNGLIQFVDRSRGELMQSNISDLISLTRDDTLLPNGVKIGKCDAWFRAKIKSMQRGEGNRYFVGTIDPITNRYLLTDYSIQTKLSLNSERTYNPLISETVSFDIATRDLKQFLEFTPEYYAFIDGDILNNQLFSFVKGKPYAHYNVNTNNSFNTFYGVKAVRVFRPIANVDPYKKKIPLWIEIYGNSYFADEILNDSFQQSRLLLAAFDKRDYFYTAAFQCDLNTIADPNLVRETGVNKLLDGDKLISAWTDIRLIGNPAEDDIYTEITGIVINSFPQASTGGA